MADMQSLKPQLAQVQQLQQILAPQLRQSLEMLQVPVMELQAMIRKELETNPTVEEVPSDKGVQIDDADPDSEVPTVRSEQPPSISDDEADGNAAPAKEADELKPLDFDREFEAIAELDREWRDYFFQDAQSRSYTEEDAERRQFLLDSLPQRKSLQDHLLEQLLAELGRRPCRVADHAGRPEVRRGPAKRHRPADAHPTVRRQLFRHVATRLGHVDELGS